MYAERGIYYMAGAGIWKSSGTREAGLGSFFLGGVDTLCKSKNINTDCEQWISDNATLFGIELDFELPDLSARVKRGNIKWPRRRKNTSGSDVFRGWDNEAVLAYHGCKLGCHGGHLGVVPTKGSEKKIREGGRSATTAAHSHHLPPLSCLVLAGSQKISDLDSAAAVATMSLIQPISPPATVAAQYWAITSPAMAAAQKLTPKPAATTAAGRVDLVQRRICAATTATTLNSGFRLQHCQTIQWTGHGLLGLGLVGLRRSSLLWRLPCLPALVVGRLSDEVCPPSVKRVGRLLGGGVLVSVLLLLAATLDMGRTDGLLLAGPLGNLDTAGNDSALVFPGGSGGSGGSGGACPGFLLGQQGENRGDCGAQACCYSP
ncbi:hypothetical protein C8J57DRAFT_1591674 [Mycena rebaudengoi]|nr:hypothetical protein C8J57DRAFT_1591674 [Mycena rebaudengoi]